MVALCPGLLMPAISTVKVTDWNGFDIELRAELVAGRYECAQIRMTRHGGGPEVTNELLRTVPVARLMKDGLLSAATLMTGVGPLPSGVDASNPSPEVLRWVSRVYVLARAVGDAPKQALASGLGVSPATAGRWIARARSAGYLAADFTAEMDDGSGHGEHPAST